MRLSDKEKLRERENARERENRAREQSKRVREREKGKLKGKELSQVRAISERFSPFYID